MAAEFGWLNHARIHCYQIHARTEFALLANSHVQRIAPTGSHFSGTLKAVPGTLLDEVDFAQETVTRGRRRAKRAALRSM
jgi:hypothetical protein